MLANVLSKVLVVSNVAGKGSFFMQRYGLLFLSHAGLAIVVSISYQVPSPGLVQNICGILLFNS